MEEKPQLYCLWYSKHHANWCGCGKNMVRWKFWDSDLCPCCLEKKETSSTHVYYWEMPEMTSFRNEQISGLVEWMGNLDTHPHLLLMITAALTGELPLLRTHKYKWWRTMKKSFMIIPQILILQGFLPKGLDHVQQD